METESKNKFRTLQVNMSNVLLCALGLLFSGSTIGFFVFGIAAGKTNLLLEDWLETATRFVLVLVSLAAVFGLLRGIRIWLFLGWQLLLAIFQFVIFPSEILSGKNESWNDLLKLGNSGQVTGFESLNFSIGISIVASILLIFTNEKTRADLKNSKIFEFARGKIQDQSEHFAKSNFFVKLSGLGVTIWALINVIFYVMGVSYGLVDLDAKFFPHLIEPLASLAIIGLIITSKWSRTRILWAVFVIVLWLLLLEPQVLSDQGGDYIFTLSNALPDAIAAISLVQTVSLWVVFSSTVGIILERVVNAYATRVKGWIDNRIAEIYSDEIAGRATDGPRTTSLLAVVSLFFAFAVPVIGLVFAHAARNEIAISRGAKLGTDLTVIAGVVSWLLIIVYALLFFVLFVAQPFVSDPYWWLSLLSNFGA